MAKHTQGEWTSEGNLIIKYGEGGRAIALLADSRCKDTGSIYPAKLDDPEWNTNAANARLIAASPDLLAACKALIDGLDEYWSTLPEGMAAIDAAKAAIAKAEQD